jgi:hypothetical protein
LDEHAGQLSILLLGASHSLTGLNPDYFSKPCFNAAYVSQSIDIDLELYKKYAPELKQLEYLVLPVSYCTMFERLETSPEYWRIKNYVLYYDLDIADKITDHSEILGNKLWFNAYRILDYYILKNNPLVCTSNGWEKRTRKKKVDMVASGKERAKLHTINNWDCLPQNTQLLKTIIELAAEKNSRVILYTPPAYKTYVQNLDPNQLKQSIDVASEMAKAYPNVSYYNFLMDDTFTETDFSDADHLNENGAKKLSLMLDERIAGLK